MLYSIFSKHTIHNVLKNNILHISFWSYFTFQNISKTIRFNFEKKEWHSRECHSLGKVRADYPTAAPG